MATTSAHSAFLSDLYRGVGAALRASDASLLEYYTQCSEAKLCLPGSLASTTSGWAYIPLSDLSEQRGGAQLKVLLRPSDGSPGKTTLVKDFGGKVTKILPAVLSSHLDEKTRRFSAAIYAKYIRALGDDAGPLVRVVVEHTADSSLIIKTAAVNNLNHETTHNSPEELVTHLNRDMLSLVSIRDAPPDDDSNPSAPGELDLEEWVIQRAAVEWRATRTTQGASKEQVDQEIQKGQLDEGFEALMRTYSSRLRTALTDVGIIDADGNLAGSITALGCLAAAVADAAPWATYVARALEHQQTFCMHLLDRLLTWVELKKGTDPDVFQPVRAAGEGPLEETARVAASILTEPANAPPPRPTSPPAHTLTRFETPPPDAPAFGSPSPIPTVEANLPRRPRIAPVPIAAGPPTLVATPTAPPPPLPPAPAQDWIDDCTQVFVPEPDPASPLDWLVLVGGAPVAKLIAAAAGKPPSLLNALSPRAASIAIKTLRALYIAVLASPDTTIDGTDDLWATHVRPQDEHDALARIEDVCNAASRPGALLPPPPPALAGALAPLGFHAGAAPPHAYPPAGHGSQQRPGQVKLPLASTAQRDARTHCSSAVLEPIHNPKLVDDEYKLGSAAARDATLDEELRRASSFAPALARSISAFVVSCGARPEDASGGVPANVSQMRQASLAALRHMAEQAKGGPQQREMTPAAYKLTSAAAEGILVGEVDVPQLVKLFGGTPPAQTLTTMGSAGAAREGNVSSKRDIEKALRFWARCVTKVLGPLLGCPTGTEDDFGIGSFFQEAEHIDPSRVMRACEETFRVISRQFQRFRTTFDAPPPDPLRAFSDALSDAIRPLAHEQNTQAIALALFNTKFNAPGKTNGSKTGKRPGDDPDTENESGRRPGSALKKPKVSFGDGDGKKGDGDGKKGAEAGNGDGDGGEAKPAGTPRLRPGSPPPPKQFRNWTGVAGYIQDALREADLGPRVQWPCCQRFLTGACGEDCRTCKRAGGPCRGDRAARQLASTLVKGNKLTDECAEQIKKGESERA